MDLIGIPARYASTRYPGKPLATIAGRTMIERVLHNAHRAAERMPGVLVRVITDDVRIFDHVAKLGGTALMSDKALASGTDRVLDAACRLPVMPRFIMNLQGDAPFISPTVIRTLFEALRSSEFDVVTPVVRLSWDALDALRESKKKIPFTGTTCIRARDGRALWFSKTVLPSIRNEPEMRASFELSPVFQHIGLYGFRAPALQRFASAQPSHYEMIEGLEQLRLIEQDEKILTVEVEFDAWRLSGIDTPEDALRSEAMIAARGDPWDCE